jgi:hypothetical protein
MNWLLSKIPHRNIVNCERQVYMTRWYLFRTKPLAVFLHRFNRSDEDRALHDHPWSFITFILWNGYMEHTPTGIKKKRPLSISFRPAEHRHRVELINGKTAWTLVFRFKERRDWGFWEKDGFIKWNIWWQNNCE